MLPTSLIDIAKLRPHPHVESPPAAEPAGLACDQAHGRRRIVWLILVLAAVLPAMASGCKSKSTLSVEGVWTDKDRPTARFLFRGDGTGRLTDDCSPPNLDIGSGLDFRWKMAGGQVQLSFKAAGRDCTGKLQDKVLVIEPADPLRFGDGHYLSNPKTLIWFAPKR